MRAYDKDRRLARRQAADQAKICAVGVGAAQRIGFKCQQAALKAVRRGRNPVVAMREVLLTARPLLVSAMLAANFTGRQRVDLPVSLAADVFGKSVDFLRKRNQITAAEYIQIEEKYGIEAAKVLGGLADTVEAKILQNTVGGAHVREGVSALREAFDAAGITPDNSFTLEAIFRTQTSLAYGAGRWEASQTPAIQEILWGYTYVTVGDDRVRDEHAGYDGVTLPKDDPFWRENWPPNGWACRCAVIEVFEEREVVEPYEVDGEMPSTDMGFRFNPGEIF